MAINIHCVKCKRDMKLTAKICKCGASIPKKYRTYRVILRYNGKRITRTCNNLELAREIEAKLKDEIRRDELSLTRKRAVTLGKAWKRYADWSKITKPKSFKTCNGYYHKHIEPWLQDCNLSEITPVEVEAIVVRMRKGKTPRGKPYADATVRHVLIVLGHIFSMGIKWGLCTDNPVRRVAKPKLNNQIVAYLSKDELERLLTVLDEWPCKMSACIVRFLLHSGVRRGEIFKIRWDAVDMERKTFCLRDPKGKRDAVLPLSDKALQILQEVPREYDTPYIFYGKEGKQRTDFKGPWQRIKKAACLPESFRLHDLRHHFASALVSAGTDLFTVQTLLNHRDSSTTQRYAHLSDNALRDALSLSDRLNSPPAETEKKVVNLRDYRHGS